MGCIVAGVCFDIFGLIRYIMLMLLSLSPRFLKRRLEYPHSMSSEYMTSGYSFLAHL